MRLDAAGRLGGASYFATGAVVAAVVAAAAVVLPSALFLMLGAALIAAFPEAVLLGAAVALEEQTSAGGSLERADALVRLGGDQFYWSEVAGLRVVTLVALVAAVTVLVRRGTPWRSLRGLDMWLALALAALTMVAAYVGTDDLLGAATAASPWVVLICGIVIGRQYAADGKLRRQAGLIVAGVVASKAALGALLFVTGRTIYDPNGLLGIVYYDSAMPTIAGVVLVALLVGRRPGSALVTAALTAASGLIMVVAMRRNAIFAVAVAAVIIPILSRRWKALGRLAVGLVAAVAVTVAVVPGAYSALSSGAVDAWATIRGDDSESSTEGHLEDIRVGWDYVQASPFRGLGYGQEPPGGLVTTESAGRLYVHNELLQDWLQLGLLGAALVVALVAAVVTRAVKVLRRGADTVTTAAGVLCITLPVNLIWFPHLSTTFRWPILAGIAAGIIFGHRPSQPGEPVSVTVEPVPAAAFGESVPRAMTSAVGASPGRQVRP